MYTKLFSLAGAVVLSGCVAMPSGPGVMVLPGTGKSFDQFRFDEANCRQYAYAQVGGQTANQAATESAVNSAVVGALLGAAVGAALDGHRGAGAGAATGLLIGSSAGAGTAQVSAYGAQRRYDHAYIQCMYAQGHRVPVAGNYQYSGFRPPASFAPEPVPTYQQTPPLPPPGSPPPPPPDAPR
jgi:hypothetical protein